MNLLLKNKAIGIMTIASALIALTFILLCGIAVNSQFEVFSEPNLMLVIPSVNIQVGKWGMIADMLGYYLLMAPCIYYMHDWMKTKTPWSNLLTFCGLAYVLIGAIGAAIAAMVWPSIVNIYHSSTLDEQLILKENFELITTMIYKSMWNLLSMLFIGIWWFATGILLLKKNKIIATISIVLGAFTLLDSLSAMMNIGPLHEVSLNIYLFIYILWAFCTGISLFLKPLS